MPLLILEEIEKLALNSLQSSLYIRNHNSFGWTFCQVGIFVKRAVMTLFCFQSSDFQVMTFRAFGKHWSMTNDHKKGSTIASAKYDWKLEQFSFHSSIYTECFLTYFAISLKSKVENKEHKVIICQAWREKLPHLCDCFPSVLAKWNDLAFRFTQTLSI